ncbi:hypothetical protein FGO68_gene12731 [Halteria grandinella]|uniref:Dynamin N-terminal domain-containing protein n=1 Tax=Halteria grandinella TaxID=5974 RepID=A0A8J8P0L3_HALGN|nr:hypothetical protein FGO68_gene12731 [Halteria grandinella]
MEQLGGAGIAAPLDQKPPSIEEVIETYLAFFKALGKKPRLPRHLEDKYKHKREIQAKMKAKAEESSGAMQRIGGGAGADESIERKGDANVLGQTDGKEQIETLDEDIINDLRRYLVGDIKIMAIGNVNSGKSTFLNNLLKMNLLNTSERRETNCLWIIKTHDEQSQQFYGKYTLMKKWKKTETSTGNEITLEHKQIYSRNTLTEFKSLVKQQSVLSIDPPRREGRGQDEWALNKITLMIPPIDDQGKKIRIFDIAGDTKVKIIDSPGAEDSAFRHFTDGAARNLVADYAIKNSDSLFPLLFIPMDQGTADLQTLMFIRDLRKDFSDINISIILTKFECGFQGQMAQMAEDMGLDNLSDQEYRAQVSNLQNKILESIQQRTINRIKNAVKDRFGSSGLRFFLFDPSENFESRILSDKDTSILFTVAQYEEQQERLGNGDELNENEQDLTEIYEDCYEIGSPFGQIYESFKKKFRQGITDSQYRSKIEVLRRKAEEEHKDAKAESQRIENQIMQCFPQVDLIIDLFSSVETIFPMMIENAPVLANEFNSVRNEAQKSQNFKKNKTKLEDIEKIIWTQYIFPGGKLNTFDEISATQMLSNTHLQDQFSFISYMSIFLKNPKLLKMQTTQSIFTGLCAQISQIIYSHIQKGTTPLFWSEKNPTMGDQKNVVYIEMILELLQEDVYKTLFDEINQKTSRNQVVDPDCLLDSYINPDLIDALENASFQVEQIQALTNKSIVPHEETYEEQLKRMKRFRRNYKLTKNQQGTHEISRLAKQLTKYLSINQIEKTSSISQIFSESPLKQIALLTDSQIESNIEAGTNFIILNLQSKQGLKLLNVPCNDKALILNHEYSIQGKPFSGQIMIYENQILAPQTIEYKSQFSIRSVQICGKQISLTFANSSCQIYTRNDQGNRYVQATNIEMPEKYIIKSKAISESQLLAFVGSSDGSLFVAVCNPLENMFIGSSRFYLENEQCFINMLLSYDTPGFSQWAIVTTTEVYTISVYTNLGQIESKKKLLQIQTDLIADFQWLSQSSKFGFFLLNLRSIDQNQQYGNRLVVYTNNQTELAYYKINCMNLHELKELERIGTAKVLLKDGRDVEITESKSYYLINEIEGASPYQREEQKEEKFDPNNKYPYFIKHTKYVTQSLLVVTCISHYYIGGEENPRTVVYFKFKTIKLNELKHVWNLTDFQVLFTSYKTVNITQGYQVCGPDKSSTDKMNIVSMEIPLKQFAPQGEEEDE